MGRWRRSPDTILSTGFKEGEQLQAADQVVQVRRDDSISAHIPAGKRMLRVLVADDNKDTANTLSVILELWGHEARVAYAGAAALQLAFTYQPDVSVLDILMPEMDGYELARRMRQEDRFQDVLLIALTGYADERHRLLAEAAGFDYYLVKPFEMNDLEKLLRLEQDRLAALLPQPGQRSHPGRPEGSLVNGSPGEV